jgi:hypothetical protein
MLFENVLDSDIVHYKVHISNIVNLYEPRVQVNDVLIENENKTITVEIIYEIISLEKVDSVTINIERTR